MSPHLSWASAVLRLVVALAAGAVIGLDRGEHGKPAGVRTTMLVCFAAALAMLLANLFLATAGKPGDSFVRIDPMRLPLGVLTGVGFIGAGTIIQRRELVVGVTTAATLWFVTVIGLCAGSGYLALALAATAVGGLILWGLPRLERMIPQEQRATLVLTCAADSTAEQAIVRRLRAEGYSVRAHTLVLADNGHSRESRFALRWRARHNALAPPAFLGDVARESGAVKSLCWMPATS